MDLERYFELRTILQRWRMLLAESIRQRIEASPRLAHHVEHSYAGEGTDEPFNVWLDRWCRQAAIQFILRILFLRVLEDRELLGTTRLRTADGQRMWAQLTRNLGAASYIQFCFWDAAHLLPDLFEPGDYDLVLPADELVQRFLDDVWRRPDPDRPGWLRFDFRPDPARRDAGFQTRFIGDLYQELDAEIRERYALLQTPDFIAQFILENTLLKRFDEMDFREVTLMDPTCGSGHFEVDAFWMFVARYEAAAGKTHEQMTTAARTQIARDIIEKHLFGCDINPYATALTRFRLVLAACDYARPASLREFRDLHFNIVTIDSLIPYERLITSGGQTGSSTANLLGQPDAITRALPVLRQRYDVVVGNPPYIVARDKRRKSVYAQYFPRTTNGKFHLGAPFTERFFELANSVGRVGLINSSAFTKRDFGESLVETFLPSVDLQAIVDLSGVSIPHHGTPTLILFGINQAPSSSFITVVSCLQSGSASVGVGGAKVWQSISDNYPTPGYRDENISIAKRPRIEFAKHPWDLSLEKADLLSRLLGPTTVPLGTLAVPDGIGISLFTLLDEIFVHPADVFRRHGILPRYIRWLAVGEEIRDWMVIPSSAVLFPYDVIDNHPKPIGLEASVPVKQWLTPYANHLATGHTATTKANDTGWYEYGRFTLDKYAGDRRIVFSAIATHNHFIVDASHHFQLLFKQSAPLVKLSDDSHHANCIISGLINSPIVCMYLKQKCYNKGAGKDPVRDRYDLSGQNVAEIPLPKIYSNPQLGILSERIVGLVDQLSALEMVSLFRADGEAYHTWNSALYGYVQSHPEPPPPFKTSRDLRSAREQLITLRQDIRGRMIFLQEEMDWLAYEMYGLIKKAPLAEDYLTPSQYRDARLALGQRPFELAGNGYTGDWPPGYQPAPLPDTLRPLADARIALIRANPDIALLEDPLYKRRWVPPDYDAEFREAAAWWLAEKLEWALEQAGRPLSLRAWARLLGQDDRVNATLEILTGTPSFDLEGELLKVIRANAVPNRPEHYLKASGLRKLYAARDTLRALRSQGDTDTPPPVPQFSREDFADATAWRLRGKLNIPRERFIYYAEFDNARSSAPDTGGPWFGWAGWDAAARADALAHLLDRAQRAGWETRWRQCGLRAALRDLLPELTELPAADRAEFEAIAGLCGIGLGTTCYCQAYREAFARGETGVPGVGEETLGVKVVVQEEIRRPAGRGRKKNDESATQLGLDFA